MDFSLSDDQRAIAEMAEGLFRDYCSDDHLRDFDLSGEPFMQTLWQACIETGLNALAVDEEQGGSALGMTDLMSVLQAQGNALGLVPLWQQQLACLALIRHGAPVHAALLEKVVSGEALLGLSLARDSGLTLSADGEGWKLDGHLSAVPLAAQAQALLLLVQSNDGPRLVLLEPTVNGVSLTPAVVNHGLAVADIDCNSVRLNANAVLSHTALDWLEPRAIAAVAALQLGVSEAQLRRTVEYVSERRQFERVIGSFQAVQMTLSDCRIAVEALRSSLYQLCYRLDAGLGCQAEALATRYLCCETGHLVGHKTQHVHGGIGVDLTYPIHRYLYWSRDLGMTLGGSAGTLERLGDWLANHDNLGWKYDLEENPSLC